MKAISKILAGAAGVAAIAGIASPASAQGYPYGGYGGYGQYGYGNQGGGVVGAILNSIINPYGRTGAYNYGGEQQQVEICVQAVNQRVSQIGYGGYGYNNGYNNGYGYNQPYGGYNQPYGGYNNGYGYNNNGYGTAQVASVDRVERHSDGVKVRGTAWSNNRSAYTPYGGYNRNYGGYSGYNARGGDIAYSCRVTSRMQVRDINLYDRRTGRQIG